MDVPNLRSYPRDVSYRSSRCPTCRLRTLSPFSTEQTLKIECGKIRCTRTVTVELLYCRNCHAVTHTGTSYEQIKQAMKEIIDE